MGKPQKRNPALQRLAVKLYEKLKSGEKVAKRLEVSDVTVYRMLSDAGVHVPKKHSAEVQERKKKLHGELAKAAAADYASGMSVFDLEKKHGVGLWAIRTAAKDQGVLLRPRGAQQRHLTPAEKAEIVRLYAEDDLAQVQVAASFGCSQALVNSVLKKAGVEIKGKDKTGADHYAWRGGRIRVNGKYIAVYLPRNDPLACMRDSMGYVMEHRLVMARHLGRPLLKHETVHHINGDCDFNEISNLQLRQGRHGKGVVMQCLDCGSHNVQCVPLADEVSSGQSSELSRPPRPRRSRP